jgi:hypothetical protein
MRRTLITVFTILGLGCGLLFASYDKQETHESTFSGPSDHSRMRVGLSFSPWYEWETRNDASRQSSSGGVQLLSWSWPVLLVGLGFLAAAMHLTRNRTKGAPAPKKESS